MSLGKTYACVLLIAAASLIGFYIALLRIKLQPVYQKPKTTLVQYEKVGQNENSNNSYLMRTGRDWSSDMQQRVEMLRQGCKERQHHGEDFENIQGLNLGHIIVNDKHKLLYCYIPKVACSNLKRIFLLLTGKMNETDPLKLKLSDVHSKFMKYLRYLNGFPKSEVENRLKNYKKIIFVREPFERVLSAFRNKLVQKGNENFKLSYGRNIIKTFRNNASEISLMMGDDVTYTEFVQYLHRQKALKNSYNEHWAAYTDLCHPCHIQYDFIGKYETIDEDVNFLLEDIGVSDTIKFPKREDTDNTPNTRDELYSYYKDLKLEFIKFLMKIYDNDFQLFGYKFPDTLSDMLNQD